MVDALTEWREESATVRRAYEKWSRTAGEDSALAYAAYAAALEREERASNAYAAAVHEVEGSASW